MGILTKMSRRHIQFGKLTIEHSIFNFVEINYDVYFCRLKFCQVEQEGRGGKG